jgi:hypothetical protein
MYCVACFRVACFRVLELLSMLLSIATGVVEYVCDRLVFLGVSYQLAIYKSYFKVCRTLWNLLGVPGSFFFFLLHVLGMLHGQQRATFTDSLHGIRRRCLSLCLTISCYKI